MRQLRVYLTLKSQQLLWLSEKGAHNHVVHGGICLFRRVRTFTFRVLEIRNNQSLVIIKTPSNVFDGSGPTMKGKLFPFHHHLWGTQFRFVCFNCYCMYVCINCYLGGDTLTENIYY